MYTRQCIDSCRPREVAVRPRCKQTVSSDLGSAPPVNLRTGRTHREIAYEAACTAPTRDDRNDLTSSRRRRSRKVVAKCTESASTTVRSVFQVHVRNTISYLLKGGDIDLLARRRELTGTTSGANTSEGLGRWPEDSDSV